MNMSVAHNERENLLVNLLIYAHNPVGCKSQNCIGRSSDLFLKDSAFSVLKNQWQRVLSEKVADKCLRSACSLELTAAGTVRDFHPIPI